MVTKFIYNHGYLLAWLRKRNDWKEIIRPGPTRFATTFLSLKSISEHKHDLQALITSKMFVDSRYSKSEKAKDVIQIVLDTKFWSDCQVLVQIVSPLVRLLRIVDADERPSLGYVYDGMLRAKKTIKKIFMNKKKAYREFAKIIKDRWDNQLRQDLHAAAYFLNPVFFFDKENFSKKPEVKKGFLNVVDKKIVSSKTKFIEESLKYQNQVDSFANPMALDCLKTLRPGNDLQYYSLFKISFFLNLIQFIIHLAFNVTDDWWKMFGDTAPNVKDLAIKLLSQTSSSSGCERNWSVFERIHSKKRNKLEHQRLNDLVFVHYNFRLNNRYIITILT